MIGDITELSQELNRLASSLKLPQGAFLFRCGDPVSGVFLIRSGTVTLALDGAACLFPSRILGPGEIVGLPATLTGTYSLSAQAAEETELGFLSAQRVNDLFESSPRLCLLAMRIIGEEVARTRAALRDGIPRLTRH